MFCHLFGTACLNIEEVKSFCDINNLMLFEDILLFISIKMIEVFIAEPLEKLVLFCFMQILITTGEGGFVVTDDEIIYNKMRYLRNQGRMKSGTFIHPEIGYNFRLTDIQSALELSQLSKLDKIIKAKQDIYKLLIKNILEIMLVF